jgi:tetratricopeptide (TPR) repeat protein
MAEHGGAKARLLRERASLARQTGAWQEALAYAEEAAATFEDAGDMSGLADATYDLGWGALLGGRFDEAEEAFDRAIELQRGAGTPELASFPMVTKAWVRRMRGDLAGAEALWEEAEEANELVTRTGVEFWRADLLVDKGDFDAAEVVALRSLECATELGFDAHRTGARYVLSRVAAARGDHRTAEILSEAAIAGAGRSGAPEIEGLARRLRAGLALQPGSGLDAAAEIDALAPFARSLGGELGPIVMGELRAGVLVDDDASAARAALGAAARFRSEFGLPLTGPEARWVATWAAAAADVVPDRDWDLGDLASFAFG